MIEAAGRREGGIPPAGRILFLHSSDEAYGADRVLLAMARVALDGGRMPVVLLPDDTDAGWLSEKLSALGVDVRRGPLAPARRRYLAARAVGRYAAALVQARKFVRRVAREVRPSIIHVNSSALPVAAVVGRPHGARLVWHVHEIVTRPRFAAALFRTLPVLTADRLVVVSDAVGRHLPTLPTRGRRARIYNGLPSRAPEPDPAIAQLPHPLVAYVGRLNRWKGYEVFIEAAAKVAATHPGARFIIAGDPPPGEEWRSRDVTQRIERSGVADRVFVLGFRRDVPSLLDAVEVVTVPSVWPDPLPTVVLEAMRAGCAVVASRHGGAVEMLEDGRSGCLVSPGSSSELAAAIRLLLDDAGLRQRLGEGARARQAAHFSDERFKQEITALWRSLEVTG